MALSGVSGHVVAPRPSANAESGRDLSVPRLSRGSRGGCGERSTDDCAHEQADSPQTESAAVNLAECEAMLRIALVGGSVVAIAVLVLFGVLEKRATATSGR